MAQVVRSTIFSGLTEVGQNITNGVCSIQKMIAINTSGAAAFIQLFDAPAASVTIGTTIPAVILTVPATAGQVDVDFSFTDWGWTVYNRLSAFATTAPTGSTGSAATVYLQVWVS